MPSAALPVIASEGNLARYMAQIREFPMLEPQQEYMLAKRWREHADQEAAHHLITSHLRLVARIAMGYRGYGLPVSELISEGNLGLMQAVKKFDPERGFRLATYAIWWIKAAIQEYILHSWSIVKLGTNANQKKLFFGLRKAKREIDALDDLSPEQVTTLAKRLDVREADVVNMNNRLSAADSSLNAPVAADAEGEWQDWLVDERDNAEIMLADRQIADRRSEWLREGLMTLNDRERQIVIARRLKDDPETLEVIAARFGISRERVRQIEVKAFEKLQTAIRKLAEVESKGPKSLPGKGVRAPVQIEG